MLALTAGTIPLFCQAIHCLGQDASGGGFSCSSGAAEKISMTHLSGSDLILQDPDNVSLTDDLGEGFRSETPI